jgi:hypothetical protein
MAVSQVVALRGPGGLATRASTCVALPRSRRTGAIGGGQFVSHGVDGGGELLVHVSAEVTGVVNDHQATGHHQRMNVRRRARNHVRSLERLGYHVTLQGINADTGELLTATG